MISQAKGANNIKKARSSFANMVFLQVSFCAILIIPCTVFLPDILILSGANIELLPISLMYVKILIYGCLVSMLAIGLISVIRNDGRPTFAMSIIVISLVLNIILDYLLYGSLMYARQNVIGNMGYCFAFFSGIVLMLISFFGGNIFPAWFNLHGNVAKLASHGLVISSTAFLLLGVIRVAGYYYQATGKIMASSLLIYGDAFFALPLCLFLLPIWFGLDGVWLAMPISRVLLFSFVCYLWWGKRRGK